MNSETLEHLLVETRTLSPMQIAVAQRDAEVRKKRLAPTLIDLGLMTEARFAEWMAKTTSFPLVDPLPSEGATELASRIPAALAREYEVIPIETDADELIVATIDPLDRRALDALHIATGMKIRPVVARYGALVQLLDRLYPRGESDAPPFEFGSETLLFAHRQPFAVGDESPGSRTQIFTPRPDVTEPSQLDRIEEKLEALGHTVRMLERKLDAIDAVLSRVLHR
jgi:Type II secretion system (T2SS), protein E, N-terminal domain